MFHYEKDEAAKVCNDEFMLGSRILAAPVVNQGAERRMVYLPEGEWYDYWTHEKLTGPVWFVREAPLDCCPIYVRAGSVIPVMEPQSYVGEKPSDLLMLEVYPGEGSWDHYLDNGEDFAYREDGGVCGQVIHAGYDRPYRKILFRRAGEEMWTEME